MPSTAFDKLAGVCYAEISTSPSDNSVIYSIVVTAHTPKILRRIDQQRRKLEDAFHKVVNCACFLRSDLTQYQTLSTAKVGPADQPTKVIVGQCFGSLNIEQSAQIIFPPYEEPRTNAGERNVVEGAQCEFDDEPDCEFDDCYGYVECCDDCAEGNRSCCHECG